jgi:hypothetical protein
MSKGDPAPEPAARERRAAVLASAGPALLIVAASFFQAEILHGSWDRLNAILAVVSPSRSNVNDALPAMQAAQALLAQPHAPIYDMSRPDAAAFLYPPIAAALYAPHVAAGSGATGSLVTWNRIVFVVVGALLCAALTGPRRRWPSLLEVAGVAAAMVLFLPAVRALELNQASLYVALFLGAAWVALDRGAEAAAGVCLALAAAVKPHLFAVAPLLFFHARRTAVATIAAGAALLAASLVYAGVPNHVTYLTHVLPEASRGYAFFPNQSFGGLLHRLVSDAPLDAFALMAPDRLVQNATLAIAAALYGGTWLLLWRARGRRDLGREAFALAWLVTTMIAPIAWGHHYAAALFPLAWLVRRVRDGEEPAAARLPAVAVGCALLGSYFVVSGLEGPARLLASYGLFGAVLAAGAFARTIAQGRAASVPEGVTESLGAEKSNLCKTS